MSRLVIIHSKTIFYLFSSRTHFSHGVSGTDSTPLFMSRRVDMGALGILKNPSITGFHPVIDVRQ